MSRRNRVYDKVSAIAGRFKGSHQIESTTLNSAGNSSVTIYRSLVWGAYGRVKQVGLCKFMVVIPGCFRIDGNDYQFTWHDRELALAVSRGFAINKLQEKHNEQ